MSLRDAIKARVGVETYLRLEKAANDEVALATQMPLVDKYQQQKFYTPRPLLGELLPECESFEQVGLKISPIDVVNVLFRCKILFACATEKEYRQRRGGFPALDDFGIGWGERVEGDDALIEKYMARLEGQIKERTLLTHLSSFTASSPALTGPQDFFDGLFAKLGYGFVCFIDEGRIIAEYERLEPGLRSYERADAEWFFSAPSIGFTVSGSRNYCFWHSSMWLRTFLNLLRIASYIHPGQRGFGWDVKMRGPTHPVFLGDRTQGALLWNQDRKQSWEKIPDGCLFLSFGYRGLSDMWLDQRTFPGIREFMLDHKQILENLKNPWNQRSIRDVAPALDILSSATQIPDSGAKILLIYCCLEHLFVPRNAYTENKKYIVGGMNALGPDLLPWFDRLYNLRCAYAHKGFVLSDDETIGLIADSMKNVMKLLVAKLSVS
jgi:hypothetical protein